MNNTQKRVIQELKVKPDIDPDAEIREIIEFIKMYMTEHSFIKTAVLGVSGGQDSTLLGKLTQMAIDELNEREDGGYEFHALRLPYGEQQDENDAADAMEYITPSVARTIDIKPAVDASVQSLDEAGYTLTDFVKGNEKARERMKVQFAVAAATSGIVLGTDHAAESLTGFYTKFGDGACDIAPLYGLNKRQGELLLEHLNTPEHLYKKVPTADLESDRPLLSDEEALGVTYEAIDDFLEGKVVQKSDFEAIMQWYDKTAHKRTTPYHRYHLPR